MEIPEGALDKFRGGAEEFIAGTRVFPPKSPIGGTKYPAPLLSNGYFDVIVSRYCVTVARCSHHKTL